MAKKKYAMMVTLKEAKQIYQQRVIKDRKNQGYLPIQKPAVPPLHIAAKRIQRAVTLILLKDEKIT